MINIPVTQLNFLDHTDSTTDIKISAEKTNFL